MGVYSLRVNKQSGHFDRTCLHQVSLEAKIDLETLNYTVNKVEALLPKKFANGYLYLMAALKAFLMVSCLVFVVKGIRRIFDSNRLDRLTEVQKSWHYNGNPFQTGVVSKSTKQFTGCSDNVSKSDLDSIISSNIEWFDSYFKDDEVQMISSETKLANYKQQVSEILSSEVCIWDDSNQTQVSNVVAKAIKSIFFVAFMFKISFLAVLGVIKIFYTYIHFLSNLRLNQQKNIRKLLEIENDQFYIAKGLYWVCNSSMTQISILRANKNLVPTGEKCHLYKLTHSCEQEEQKRPAFGIDFFSKFPSKVSSVFNPKPHQHPPCQCQGCYHQQACHRPYMSRMGWYSPEQEYMMHGGMGPSGMMPPGQFMAPSVHQNFVNVYSTNIVTPNLPGLRNRRTAEQYLDPTGGEWYVQDDEVMSDPGTRSFLDTENTSDKETVKKRGSQAGSRYYPQRRADSGTASIKLGAPWLSPRGKKKTQKAFRSNVSSKQ